MRVRTVGSGETPAVAAWHETSQQWIDLDAAAQALDPAARGESTRDVLAFLAARERGRDIAASLMDRAVAEGVAVATPTPARPLQPASLRCFMGWEQHWSQAAHQLVRRNIPAAMPFIRGVEMVTRKDFPALRPGASFSDHPMYYTGNHLTILGDGDVVPWPSYSDLLDFELEFGMIVDRPLRDATSAQGADAIGGFVVFNDLSARDTQWDEQRNGSFGPVVKTKTFASSMGSVVVTADEVLDRLDDLSASVVVDGETWSSTGTAGLRWGPGDTVAYASRGEDVFPGEMMTSGTLPSGCGLELDRWIAPGNTVTLSIDVIGSVTNAIGAKG
ncbi:hypothetical protein ASG12_08865 [Williamsia sp. Leaf354]|uniref:fumarylacetoacetate hydrolase family protein n=1 Tax=Williamsia sp. Leaf354 TaxID=1736349 RepID=UPI0006F333D1|nr:fumarylacetoacetate hydrolase family protein [Williamsia sp. Leaf354]KQR98539.1 hypothetical protein ASG12_08865 [Williamsia sp. Leaf354]